MQSKKSEIDKTNYFNNKEMVQAINDYREKVKNAEKEGKPIPSIPNYIGEKIFLLADRLGNRHEFRNYTYLDEMKQDAIENCFTYFHNFDPNKVSKKTGKKFDNPHAYFTKIMWNAFIRRIQKEKKQNALKYKNLIKMHTFEEIDEYSSTGGYSNPYIDEMLETMEKKENSKKEKK